MPNFAAPNNGINVKRWTVGCLTFPVVRRDPRVRPGKHPNLIKIMYKNNENGWNNNTHLGVNLKTQLLSDRKMKLGKDYLGVLRRDVECDEFLYDEHFTFTEALPWSMKRNPKVFNGKYISVTRQDNGTLRLNFKQMPKLGANLTVARYTFGVYLEVHKALKGLIGKR